MDVLDRQYAKKLLEAATSGLLSHTVDDVNKTITFKWKDGTTDTLTFNQPADGVGIEDINVDDDNHLIIKLTDGSSVDVGTLPVGEGGNYDDSKIINDIADLKNGLAAAKSDIEDNKISAISYVDNELTLTTNDSTTKTVTIKPNLVELADVDINGANNGDVVIYSTSKGKFTIGQITTSDQYVKMSATDTTSGYLSDLIDNETIKNIDGKLEIEKIKGQNITVDELNTLLGMDTNIKETFKALSSGGMTFRNVVDKYADLPPNALNGDVYIVKEDETCENNRNAYIYSEESGSYILMGSGNVEIRDFTTNPIDLEKEVINKLPKDNIDTTDLVDKTVDVISGLTYPIPDEDLEKFPNLHVLKQINEEVVSALNGKVNVADIVDSLTDNSANKPLSARQGYEIDQKSFDNLTFNSSSKEIEIHSKDGTIKSFSAKEFIEDILATVGSSATMYVDNKPTCTVNGDKYITSFTKEGIDYTTEDNNVWFYYKEGDNYLQTIFIEGQEITIKSGGLSAILEILPGSHNWSINGYDTGVCARGIPSKVVPNENNTEEVYRLDLINYNDDTKEFNTLTTDNLKGADGVILDNVGYFGVRVENGDLYLYVNVDDNATGNADDFAPPLSIEGPFLYYTIGGTIKYESKEVI